MALRPQLSRLGAWRPDTDPPPGAFAFRAGYCSIRTSTPQASLAPPAQPGSSSFSWSQ